MALTALTEGDVILIAVAIAIPVAAITFILGAASALRQVGKGQFAVQFEHDLPQRPGHGAATGEVREDEIRQMVQAKAYRQRARGEAPVDVDAEVTRLLDQKPAAGSAGRDAALREEVRQLVLARNERRMRKGEQPLDVEAEVDRQLRDLEGLGQ